MIRIFRSSPWRRPALTTVFLLVAVLGMQVHEAVHRSQVLAPSVVAQAELVGAVNVEVHTDFVPEAFNVKYLQKFANAVSVEGRTARLFGVDASGLDEIGGLYWVKRIDLIGGS